MLDKHLADLEYCAEHAAHLLPDEKVFVKDALQHWKLSFAQQAQLRDLMSKLRLRIRDKTGRPTRRAG
jgi:hypothetical protein